MNVAHWLPAQKRPSLEIWGGVECTVRRVGDGYLDQVQRSGHDLRREDLERFAAIGIRTLRYPVLWERTAPLGLDRADWTWADERLSRLRQLGVEPVAGLLHHGSGPRNTSLVDAEFPQKLAAYAAAVARRYPWVRRYTPVNEPLTTARFSGLYGHWYPHGRSAAVFARALLNQCRGTVLAMRAIREVVPHAELIQTEDLAKTFSTPPLAYQAGFENERRWASFDLLCGRLPRGGLMWGWLRESGITEAELEWFHENPCPPQVAGVNYYVTSERFLDHRWERYPCACRGGNGRHAYADVEAVRARPEGLAGWAPLIREAWERFHLPLAITEVHLGGSREAQLQWLAEAWEAAHRLRKEEVEVRALTAWSLLGAFEWNSLLTQEQGYYEPGVFDIRGPSPRETALGSLLRELAAGRAPAHPVLRGSAWWRRPERLLPEARKEWAEKGTEVRDGGEPERGGQPVLITGGNGTLGQAFARVCRERGLLFHLVTREEMDIAVRAPVDGALAKYRPWALVNAAGYVRVDEAERERERCFRENTRGPAMLAAACARRGVKLLSFSSDLVFDGRGCRPYLESDPTAPLGWYGRSKVHAERRMLAADPTALIVRSGAFFGSWDGGNFLAAALANLRAGRPFRAAMDVRISPTYLPDLVNMCLDLLIDDARGVWHLANRGEVSWFEFAGLACEAEGVGRAGLRGVPVLQMGHAARRPLYSVLGSEFGCLLPDLNDAILRFLRQAAPPAAA